MKGFELLLANSFLDLWRKGFCYSCVSITFLFGIQLLKLLVVYNMDNDQILSCLQNCKLHIHQLAHGNLSKRSKGPSIRMALVDDTLARGKVVVKPSDILVRNLLISMIHYVEIIERRVYMNIRVYLLLFSLSVYIYKPLAQLQGLQSI